MPTEKTPCPKCGRLITALPGPRQRHINKCDGTVENVKPSHAPKVAPPKKIAPETLLGSLDRNDLTDEQKRALTAMRARLTAPDAEMGFTASSKRERLVAFAKNEGLIPEGFEPFFGLPDPMDRKMRPTAGYFPLRHGGEELADDYGCPMYIRPIEMGRQMHMEARRESKARLAGPTSNVHVNDGGDEADVDMSEHEEISVTESSSP